MNDATYAYGFGRLYGLLPPDTTGAFPDDFYSSAYNAAQGTAGLASAAHRDQGILDYEFMLANSQSGPAPQRFRNPRRCRMRPAPQPPGQPSTNLVHLAHAHARDRSVA